jgi:hypothetical protein
VLVPQVGQVVRAIDIVPDELLWELDWGEWLSHISELRLVRDLSAWSVWVDILSKGCILLGPSSGKKGVKR